MKRQEHFLRKEKKWLYSTNRLLCVSIAPFWRISTGCKQRTLLFVSRTTRMRCFHAIQSINKHRSCILVARLTNKRVRCLHPVDILQNSTTLKQRRLNCWIKSLFCFLCTEKVFSSLHKIQIEPLMADGLFWRCFSYFIWTLTVQFIMESMGQSQASRFSSKIS